MRLWSNNNLSLPMHRLPKRTSFKRQSQHGEVSHQLEATRITVTDHQPDIDLVTLIPSLDGAASDLVAHQRDALVQRKDLAQKTKDFRKLDDAGKLREIK